MAQMKIALCTICCIVLYSCTVSCQLTDVIDAVVITGERAISGVVTPVEKVVIATTLKKCNVFKDIFGVTYEQLKGSDDEPDINTLTVDLITHENKTRFNLTDASNDLLKSPHFDVNKPVIFFLHGFLASADGEGATTVTKSLVAKGGMNVLALDSSSLIMYLYLKSSTCVRFIGTALGKTLAGLTNGGIDPKNIHVVGHSLGAHIAGFAGKTYKEITGQTLARITGLDPAGPCFFQEKIDLKLKESDADFVDVIHTDAGVLGLVDPIGHVDFYPNDGEQQPGCIIPPCSHSRAWELYSASIDVADRFPSVKCVGWDTFISGSCNNSESTVMGFDVDKSKRGKYYLETYGIPPFGFGGPQPEAASNKTECNGSSSLSTARMQFLFYNIFFITYKTIFFNN